MRWLLGVLSLTGIILGMACSSGSESDTADKQRQASITQRSQVFAKAEDIAPLPAPRNFPLRKALVEYTNRQDLINHPWYIYVLGQTGNTVGYFVGKTYPISTCDFLSSTENVYKNDKDNGGGIAVLTAPSLDGIYYGGSGAVGGCDYFFFDAATDAMQVISHNIYWFVSDQPLALNTQPIKVVGQ